ncbi:Protein FAM177B [Tupaia chinensis]|uniref:Protein FAM177B n=1 Tax=Tupaia chinensis TaxID=246437 RepID=L8Y153_TUPCH|nr:Protein FAM177B [Tupaia chinensis]
MPNVTLNGPFVTLTFDNSVNESDKESEGNGSKVHIAGAPNEKSYLEPGVREYGTRQKDPAEAIPPRSTTPRQSVEADSSSQ